MMVLDEIQSKSILGAVDVNNLGGMLPNCIEEIFIGIASFSKSIALIIRWLYYVLWCKQKISVLYISIYAR
jgi:hypothetical protein